MKKVINTVYSTNDYSLFKRLDGNRAVSDGRVEKILKSIDAVGFIEAPIICNEKYEIIDGQGRFEACKIRSLPVPFMIIPALGIEACTSMNIYQEKWSITDYINSGADRGIESYVRLKQFLDESPYSLKINIRVLEGVNAYSLRNKIMAGTLELTDAQIAEAKKILNFYRNFDEIPTNNRSSFYSALRWCYSMPEVNKKRLIEKVNSFPRNFMRIANTADAIELIEDVYNNRLRGERVFIKTLYVKMTEGNKNFVPERIARTKHSGFKRRTEE